MQQEFDSHLGLERRRMLHVRTVAYSALGLVVALPWLHNLGLTYSWSYPKLFALQTAAVIAWAGLLAVRPVRTEELLTVSGVGLPVTLILAWCALSTTWSSARWAAMQPFVELSYMAMAVVGFANLLTSASVRRWFTVAYGCSAGAVCLVYALCSIWAESHMEVYPFANPNVAASFALVPLGVGLCYAVAARSRRVAVHTGVVGGLVACAACAAILASGSAAATAAALGTIVLVIVFSLRGRSRRIPLEILGCLLVLTILWPLLAPGLWPHKWLRKELGARPALWQGAKALALENPIRGLGLGTFPIEYSRVHPREYAAHELRSETVEKAHCLPLHIVAELGLVGLALAAWLFLCAVRKAKVANDRASTAERILLRGLVCGCLGMLAQGLVGVPLHYVEANINLVLALAMIGGMAGTWWRRNPPGTAPSWALRIIPAVLLLGIYVLTAGPGLVSQIRQCQAFAAPNDEARIEKLQQAVSATWPTLWTLHGRGELAAAYYRNRCLQASLHQLQTMDRLAPNIAKVRRDEAGVRLNLGHIDAAADAIFSYCRKEPFDRIAYETWAGVLEEAAQRGRAHVARAEDAMELLNQVEEQLRREILENWHDQIEEARQAGRPLSDAELAGLFVRIRDTHKIGTLKLPDVQALKRRFRAATNLKTPGVAADGQNG